MNKSSSQRTMSAKLRALTAVAFSVCGFVGTMQGAEPAFDGGAKRVTLFSTVVRTAGKTNT